MDRRVFLAGAAAMIAAPLAAEAQQPPKSARIGFLSLSSGPTPTMDISPGLRELGWIEGENIAIEYRWAAGREEGRRRREAAATAFPSSLPSR
jgi:putative ABC transport system substrate-binding protein